MERKLTQAEIEERAAKRAAAVHQEVVNLERSKYHPSGWNPMFHTPGLLERGNIHVARDEKDS